MLHLWSSALVTTALILGLPACGQRPTPGQAQPPETPFDATSPTSSALAQGINDTAIVSGATYRLINPKSNLALDVAGGSRASGANVQVWTPNTSGAQQWLITDAGRGYATLQAQISGLCLDAQGGGWTAGTNVQQYGCNNTAAQQWKIVGVGDGVYKLLNRNANLALDLAGGTTTAGTNVQVWTDANAPAQQFKFERMDGGAAGGSTGDGAVVGGVTVYQHSNYGGASQVLTGSSVGQVYQAADLGGVGDNAISSLNVPPGMQVYACDDASQAKCTTYDSGDHSYVGDAWNDKISYLEVFGTPTGGGTTPSPSPAPPDPNNPRGTVAAPGSLVQNWPRGGSDAMSVTDFVNTLGINTHLGYGGPESDVADVARKMNYLGIRIFRDGLWSGDAAAQHRINTLIQQGFKAVLYTNLDEIGALKSQLPNYAGGVLVVENGNEPGVAGPGTPDDVIAVQDDLYQAVKGVNAGILVATPGWDGGKDRDFTRSKNASVAQWTDLTNEHQYNGGENFGVEGAWDGWNSGRDLSGKGNIVTEIGWESATLGAQPGMNGYVTDDLIDAKHTIRAPLFNASTGYRLNAFYALNSGNGEFFGFFDRAGTPYKKALALHNLVSVLVATGPASASPDTLPYSLSDSQDLQTLLLKGSDGHYKLAMWYTPYTTTVADQTKSVTLSFTTSVKDGRIFAPLNGTSALRSFSGTQVQLEVPDHPLILDLAF